MADPFTYGPSGPGRNGLAKKRDIRGNTMHARLFSGSRTRRQHVLAMAALVVTLAVLLLPPAGTQAQTTGCVGWQGYTERRIQYTSDGVLHLVGCGEVFTLTDVLNALNGNAVFGTPPAGALQLVDPAAKTWLLNVKLIVEEGATLNVIGGGGDANWLRLRSDGAGFVYLKAMNGNLRLERTKVTSWDAGISAVDTNPSDGRAFIVARTVWDGRATAAPTPCSVNGGSQEAYEARLDVVDSDVGYLGYLASESYGITWKVYSKNPPPGRGLYELVDVFGTVTGSSFHHNYFGAFTYGAYCMNWSGNLFENNHGYGLDPHDDSDALTITDNVFRNNGNHGMICSVYCSDIVIRDNQAYGNTGNGIMLHRRVDNAIIENNSSYDNTDSGIAIFDSHWGTIRGNTLANNGNAGIRFSVGSSNNMFENNTIVGSNASGQNGYAIYSIMGSDLPTEGTNRRIQNNTFRNNQVTAFKGPVIKMGDASNSIFDGNTMTASSSLTTFEFRDGSNNLVSNMTHNANINFNTYRSSSSAPAASTTLRNTMVGKTAYIKHSPPGGASTRLEDSEFHIWQGIGTVVGSTGSSATLTAGSTAAKTLDFTVRPPNGTVIVTTSTWNTTSPYDKAWTETSSTTTGSVPHTVGNLQPNTCFDVRVGSNSIGRYTANESGRIAFTYSGGYGSARSFTVIKASECAPPPDTTITAGPTGTVSSRTATFTYTSDPTGATFECKLDSGSWQACAATGKSYTDLVDGTHTFSVRAVTSATDPTAATRTWTIDSTAPAVTASPGGGAFDEAQSVTLAANESATIFYTTDGTDPTATSTRYTAAIAIQTTTTLKFIGHDAVGNTSAVTTETYTIDTTAPAVTADPPGDLYMEAQAVTLTADEPATIYYTTDGTTPTSDSATYAEAIAIEETTTLQFFAIDEVGNESAVALELYTIAAPPDTTIESGPSGEVNSADATFTYASSDTLATFECRLDEAAFATCPTTGQTLTDLSEGDHTFEVRAVGIAGTDASPASRSWTVDVTAPSVSADPPGGAYLEPLSVTLTSDDSAASISFTTDGSDPATSGITYTQPIAVDTPTTVSFIAVDTAGNVSAVQTEDYTFDVDFTDDFETGDMSRWDLNNGLVVQSEEVAGGTHAARATSAGSVAYARETLPTGQTELYYRTRFNVVSQGPNTVYLLRLRTAENGQRLGLYLTSGGRLYIYTSNGVIGVTTTSMQVVSRGEWHEVQVRVQIDGTEGQTEVWFDGSQVAALSGTRDLGTAPIGRVELGESTSGRTFDVVFDDVAVDTAFIQPPALRQSAAPPAEQTETLANEATATVEPTPDPTSTPDPTPAPTSTPEPTPTVEPSITGTGVIANTGGDGVNLRTAPDAKSDVIAVLPEGTAVDLAGSTVGDWQPVRWQGQYGYVASQFVAAGQSSSVPTSTATTTEAPSEPTPEPTETPLPIIGSGDSVQSAASHLMHDGDPTSSWLIESSAPLNELSFVLDLGQSQPIESMTWAMATTGTVSTIEIRLSDDGQNWYSLVAIDGASMHAGQTYEQPVGIRARYVMVVMANPSGLLQLGGFAEIALWPAAEAQPLSTLGDPVTPMPASTAESTTEQPTTEPGAPSSGPGGTSGDQSSEPDTGPVAESMEVSSEQIDETPAADGG